MSRDTTVTTVDLLRHGLTEAGQCFLGSTDASLNETGWQQMQSAQLSQNYQRVVSSPLIRCQSFASKYAQQNKLPLEIKNDFREIDFGLWEGKTSAALWESEQQDLLRFWENPFDFTPPQAESMQCFKERVICEFKKMIEDYQGEKILLVSHGGVIKVIACHILQLDTRNLHQFSVEHGRVTGLSVWADSARLEYLNR